MIPKAILGHIRNTDEHDDKKGDDYDNVVGVIHTMKILNGI